MVSKTVRVNVNILNTVLIKVGLWGLVTAGIAVIVSAVVASPFMAVSVLSGAILGVINLSILVKTAKHGVLCEPDKAQRFVMKRYYLRLLLTLIVIGVLVSKNLADPLGIIIGLSTITVITVIMTIYCAKKEFS